MSLKNARVVQPTCRDFDNRFKIRKKIYIYIAIGCPWSVCLIYVHNTYNIPTRTGTLGS